MAGDPEMQLLNRTLREISHNQKAQNRILEALNSNLVVLARSFTPDKEDVPPGTREIFGWNKAAALQMDGLLKVGDMKYEQDESIWFWTGEKWEPVELPSTRTT